MGERLRQIGEVAERVDLSLRTLRYWDEIGLAAPSARTEGGFRLYSEGDVQRLLLLKEMKPLGLPLDEMASLADLLARPAGEVDLDALDSDVETLTEYAARAGEAIEKLNRDLRWARALRADIGEAITRLRSSAPRRPAVRNRAR